MLGKLLKYEIKASSKLFLILYGALILASILNVAAFPLQNLISSENAASMVFGVIQGFLMLTYVILMIAIPVVTLIVIIIRFYKNLLGDEGYLMFTLPVSTDAHIQSKLINAIIWSISSAIVMFIGIFIMVARIDSLDRIGMAFNKISEMGFNIPLWLICILITLIVYITATVFMFYTGMSIGPNLTKNRILGSFLGYIFVYIAVQAVSLASVLILNFSGIMEKLDSVRVTSEAGFETAISMFNTVGIGMFIYINLLNVITITGCYIVTRYFIKNKLNLS